MRLGSGQVISVTKRRGSSGTALILGPWSDGVASGGHGWALWSMEATDRMKQGGVPLDGSLEVHCTPALLGRHWRASPIAWAGELMGGDCPSSPDQSTERTCPRLS